MICSIFIDKKTYTLCSPSWDCLFSWKSKLIIIFSENLFYSGLESPFNFAKKVRPTGEMPVFN